MSVFLDPRHQLIDLTIYYIEERKPHGTSSFRFIQTQEEFNYWKSKGYMTRPEIEKNNQKNGTEERSSELMIDNSKIVESIRTKWRRMTWADQNSIYAKSIRSVPVGENRYRHEIDGIRFRDNKLKTCLKAWDLKDDDGNSVECNSENIDRLYPEVAEELLRQFEKLTEPAEEDLKN